MSATLLVILLSAVSFGCWMYLYVSRPGPDSIEENVVVLIPKGAGLKEISRILADRGLIRDDPRFLLLAKYLGVATRLQAGEFLLAANRLPADVLQSLVDARPLHHRLTIPEGLRLEEIADRFAADGWVNRENFIRLAQDPAFTKSLGVEGVETLEGYLFPDTYLLPRDFRGEEKIITLMVNRFQKMWSDLEQEPQAGMSVNDVVTLASIIEKETGQAAERPRIASVFHNRLKRNMRLQSDPTVIYGIENFSGNLTRKDLKTPTPFNTYVIKGLPPHPICNPGKEAVVAVLEPEESKFIFFVSKNDGSHHFSTSLKEHNRAVNRYQRKKK
ncbi:MAG: endolytic transglycosylase MltG [Thermodesulfobacteriota bacterium]